MIPFVNANVCAVASGENMNGETTSGENIIGVIIRSRISKQSADLSRFVPPSRQHVRIPHLKIHDLGFKLRFRF
jgi:hypothetical protein